MMDRKDLLKRIDAKSESLAAEQDREQVILINLGQALLESRPSGGTPDELFSEVDGIAENIRDMEESLRTLLEEEERRKDRLEESRTLKVEVRNLNSRRDNAYEDLGRASWEIWKAGKNSDPAMDAALSELNRADERLHDAEVAAFRDESGVDSDRKSIFARGRALLLAGRKRSASASLDRLWAKAGRQVYDNVNLDSLVDSPASPALVILAELDSRMGEIISRQQAISTDNEALEKLIGEMPGKGPLRKHVSGLEKRIDESRRTLDSAFLTLGGKWSDANGNAAAKGDVERSRKELAAAGDTIRSLENDLEALRTHDKYQLVEADAARKAARVRKIEQDIKDRQTELKAEKKELASREKELAKLSESLPPLPDVD